VIQQFDLGVTLRDKITGYEGVVVGFVQYISGCNQYLIRARVTEKGKDPSAGEWIDEQRCELVGTFDKIVLDNRKTPGADRPPEKR
jgi:hypothetical protein